MGPGHMGRAADGPEEADALAVPTTARAARSTFTTAGGLVMPA